MKNTKKLVRQYTKQNSTIPQKKPLFGCFGRVSLFSKTGTYLNKTLYSILEPLVVGLNLLYGLQFAYNGSYFLLKS